jgi:hypothetical protein
VAEGGRPGGGGSDPPAHLQDAADQAQVDPVDGLADTAKDQAGGRGVVGDHVGQGEGVAGVAGVEDVDGRGHGGGGGQHLGRPDPPPGQLRPQQERDLGLDPGLDELAGVQRLAHVEQHGVGQLAVQRLGHAHLGLLGPAGQAELNLTAAPAAVSSRTPASWTA